ncbi:MAG: glutaminase, partial [Ignavibacteriaceae bacterium]|nr:glutaminase [Ignavibacteriaceae bacterium]
IKSHADDANNALLNFVREISDNPKIIFDSEVAASEKETSYRNTALVNFMKGCGNINNNVDDVLDIYFHQCALSMSCADVARAFLFLANRGIIPSSKKIIIDARQAKRINALMLTCGLYDAIGDFAYWVGLPGKSGVGGGIAAVIPKVMSICVWSPELNITGNSIVGTKALELFTTKTAMSIF